MIADAQARSVLSKSLLEAGNYVADPKNPIPSERFVFTGVSLTFNLHEGDVNQDFYTFTFAFAFEDKNLRDELAQKFVEVAKTHLA